MSLNEIPIVISDSLAAGAGQSLTPALTPPSGKRIKLLGGEVSVDGDGEVEINIAGDTIGPGILPARGGSKIAPSGPILGDVDEEITVDVVGTNAEIRLQYVISD